MGIKALFREQSKDGERTIPIANFKTPHFGQSLRQTQILILKILNVFLRLKFSLSLTLTKLKRFETGSL